MRPDRRKLIRKALKYHAPMSDAQLCWLLSHFGMKSASTKRLRHKMTEAGEIRFARKAERTSRGQAVCLWELAPVPK
jgi:hypothetical protein